MLDRLDGGGSGGGGSYKQEPNESISMRFKNTTWMYGFSRQKIYFQVLMRNTNIWIHSRADFPAFGLVDEQ